MSDLTAQVLKELRSADLLPGPGRHRKETPAMMVIGDAIVEAADRYHLSNDEVLDALDQFHQQTEWS